MKKRNRKSWFWFSLAILFFLFALCSVGYAGVMQAILSYEKFGVVFVENIFIPHESAWWFFGGVGFIPATIMVEVK